MALSIGNITQRRHFVSSFLPILISCAQFFPLRIILIFFHSLQKDTGLTGFTIRKQVKFDYLVHAPKLTVTFQVRFGDLYSLNMKRDN